MTRDKKNKELERRIKFFEGEAARLGMEAVIENSPKRKFQLEEYKREAVEEIELLKKILNKQKTLLKTDGPSAPSIQKNPITILTEVIEEYFKTTCGEHDEILSKNITNLSLRHRDVNSVPSSTYIIDLGKLYAKDLIERSLKAWSSIKYYFDKQNLHFDDQKSDIIKKIIDNHIEVGQKPPNGELRASSFFAVIENSLCLPR